MVTLRDIFNPRDERGFSLTELMVVLGVMGFLLGSAYAAAFIMQRSAEVTEANARFTQEIGTGLELAEIYLQQNSALEEWEDNRIAMFTDRDLDGFAERAIIEAHDDGRLTLEVWRCDMARNNIEKLIDFTMSEDCVNVREGIPLITYLDGDGNEVATLEERPSETRSVIVRIAIEHDDRVMTDDREVNFRNRR